MKQKQKMTQFYNFVTFRNYLKANVSMVLLNCIPYTLVV